MANFTAIDLSVQMRLRFSDVLLYKHIGGNSAGIYLAYVMVWIESFWHNEGKTTPNISVISCLIFYPCVHSPHYVEMKPLCLTLTSYWSLLSTTMSLGMSPGDSAISSLTINTLNHSAISPLAVPQSRLQNNKDWWHLSPCFSTRLSFCCSMFCFLWHASYFYLIIKYIILLAQCQIGSGKQ